MFAAVDALIAVSIGIIQNCAVIVCPKRKFLPRLMKPLMQDIRLSCSKAVRIFSIPEKCWGI